MFQLSVVDPEHSYFDQSVTFMGLAMEDLRSMLAKWLEAQEETPEGTWNPIIGAGVNIGEESESRRTVEFKASTEFGLHLSGLASMSCLSKRFVKMRLLWELQSNLKDILDEDGASPSHGAALMLCFLSFLAVCVDFKENESDDARAETVGQRQPFCCIRMDEAEKPVFDIAHYTAVVRAALSPQDIHMEISFSRVSCRSDITITARLCNDNPTTIRSFLWEAWRDAFGGSIEGMRIWKAQQGLKYLPVLRSKRSIAASICEIDASNTGTGKNLKTWAGWLPAHAEVCKYEIMSDGLILHRKTIAGIQKQVPVRTKNCSRTVTFRREIYEKVPYLETKGDELKHASLVAHEFVRRASDSSTFPLLGWKDSSEDLRSRADNILDGRTGSDSDVALLLYEVAAVEKGDVAALERAFNMLVNKKDNVEAVNRAVALLERFYSSDSGGHEPNNWSTPTGGFRDAKWVKAVNTQYEALLTRASFVPSVLLSYIEFCLVLSAHGNENAFEDGIMALSKALVHFSFTTSILPALKLRSSFESLADTKNKDMFFLRCALHSSVIDFVDLQKSKATSANSDRVNSVFRHWSLKCFKGIDTRLVQTEIHSKELKQQKSTAQNRLASLLIYGGENAVADAPRAVELYTGAIEEGGEVLAMYNLARLLKNGADGVAVDAPRAVELYTRAIEEGKHVMAMNNLAYLLENGADGVAEDAPRAVELYTRAIEEGNYVNAMYNLAYLLENGADGVAEDSPRALELYTRAIEEGNHVMAMCNLARLLKHGADGVAVDAPRAMELYTRAMEEGNHVMAMNNLAYLLANGPDGVEVDAPRAVKLYTRAIDEGNEVAAMKNLAYLLENGADGVEVDAPRALELRMRAQRCEQ